MLLFFVLFSCEETTEVEDIELIDVSSWSMINLETDLLKNHQPDVVECDISAFTIEIDQLEIRTDYCNYAAIEFETQKAIKSGTVLEALILHTGLWALEEAEAHFAFYIDGDLFWEEFSPIPADTEFFFHEAVIQREIPQGAAVYFHLHNHGANNWKLGYLQEVE